MRTSTAAWLAVLVVMTSHGPFTTAEAAPARRPTADQQKQRSFSNASTPFLASASSRPHNLGTPSSSFVMLPPPPSSLTPILEPSILPITDSFSSASPTHTRRKKTSESALDYDHTSVIERLIEEGILPETANTVVTTIVTDLRPTETETYTITYTETSSPAPDAFTGPKASPSFAMPFALRSSISLPFGTGNTASLTGVLPPTATHFRPSFGQSWLFSSDLLPTSSFLASSTEFSATQISSSLSLPTTSSIGIPHVRPNHRPQSSDSETPTQSKTHPRTDAKSSVSTSKLHPSSATITVTKPTHTLQRTHSNKGGPPDPRLHSSEAVFPLSDLRPTEPSRTEIGINTPSSPGAFTGFPEFTGPFFNVSAVLGPRPTNPFTLMRPSSESSSSASSVMNPFTLLIPTPTEEPRFSGGPASSSSSTTGTSEDRAKHTSSRTTTITASRTNQIAVSSDILSSSALAVSSRDIFSNFPHGTGRPQSDHGRPPFTINISSSSAISSELASILSPITSTGTATGTATIAKLSQPTHTSRARTSSFGSAVTTAIPELSSTSSTATGNRRVNSILSSVKSEARHAVSEIAHSTNGSQIPAAATSPLAALHASLDSKLSAIVGNITDTALAATLTSAFSSILTDAATSLDSTLNSAAAAATTNIPTSTGTTDASANSASVLLPFTTPTATLPITVAGTSLSLSIPTSQTTVDLTGATTTDLPAIIPSTDNTTPASTESTPRPTIPINTTPADTTIRISTTPVDTNEQTTPTATTPRDTTVPQTTVPGTSPVVIIPTSTTEPVTTGVVTTPAGSSPTGTDSTETTAAQNTVPTSTPTGSASSQTSPVITGSAGSTTSAATTSQAKPTSTPVGTSVTSSSSTGSNTNTTSALAGVTESSSIALTAGTTGRRPSASTATTDATLATPSSSSASSTVLATTAETTPTTVHSIVPTATNTDTSLTLPTDWTFAPSSSTPTATGQGIAIATSTDPSTTTGIPTYIPQLVQPPSGMPQQPANTTLIQVGFEFGLNYPFVVSNQESASQIFAFLPQGIAYGLAISSKDITMNALLPYDTTTTLGFITTLAQAYVPSDMVTQLKNGLHNSTSLMYSNVDTPVNALMSMINPKVPILPGLTVDGIPAASTYSPGSTSVDFTNNGAPLAQQASASKQVKGTSVGIGVGAVAGAAVYAAAMVYIARRYRQKRKGHQRASSVPPMGEASRPASGGMGGFFMSGGRGFSSYRDSADDTALRGSRTSAGSSNGRSVREQGISAPIMSENSLGWT